MTLPRSTRVSTSLCRSDIIPFACSLLMVYEAVSQQAQTNQGRDTGSEVLLLWQKRVQELEQKKQRLEKLVAENEA